MQTHGIPNDLIVIANPIACIIMLPILQKGLYPYLAKKKLPFGSVARISTGFLTAAFAMGYAAGLQKLIYSRSPCYAHPLSCKASDGPNRVDVFLQLPIYVLLAIAEILASVSGSEFAYNTAPPGMKSLIQALYVLSAAAGSTLNIAVAPLAHDPHLVVLYSILGGTMLIVTLVFWLAFRKHDQCVSEN